MEVGYQFPEEDRLHDNLFVNPWLNIGLDIGLGIAGSGLVGRSRTLQERATYASKHAKSIIAMPERANSISRASLAGEDALRTRRFGKSLKRFGKVFGLIGVAQLGFELGSAVVGTANSFAVSKSEAEAMRYRRMFDQDTYYDTRGAYTQRQRGLQVLHNSRLSLKPVLGNESAYLHY